MKLSLKLRLVIVYGALITGSLGVLGFVELKGIPGTRIQGWEQQVSNEALLQLNRAADVEVSRVMEEVEDNKESLRQLGVNPVWLSIPGGVAGLSEDNRKLLGGYLGSGHFTTVDFVSPQNGAVVLSSRRSRIGMMSPDIAFVRKMKANTDVAIHYSDSKQNNGKLIFALPIRQGHGLPTLVAVGTITPDTIFRILVQQGRTTHRGRDVDLVVGNGKVLASSDSTILLNATRPDLYRIAAQGGSGLSLSSFDYGQEQILAYRYVPITPDYGWGVVVRESRKDLLSSLRFSSQLSIFLVLLASALAFVISVFVARSLTRPLIQLTAAAKSFVAGDFHARSQVHEQTEIGELASAFDDMADFLDKTVKELRKAKEDADSANQELRETMHELEHLVDTDRLTGAWNRRYFDSMIEREVRRSDRYGLPLSLMIFDVDNFKQVNDTHGHDCGDQVLTEIAARVKAQIRASDALIRWGGEEFLVVSSSTTLAGAVALAEKVRITIAATPFAIAGTVTVSVGVVQYRQGEQRRDWVQRADKLMYIAKNNGRNQVVANLPGSLGQAPFRLEWHERFMSGNEQIDQEHREMFALLNQMMASLSQSTGTEGFMVLLPGLVRHLHMHFANEEIAMEKVGFTDLPMHSDEHALLLRYIDEAVVFLSSGAMHPVDFMEYVIRHVAIGHIIGYDLQYFPLMKRRGNADREMDA